MYLESMAMMLRPAKRRVWLGVDEIIRRLRSEFSQVNVMPGATFEYALNLAAKFRADGHIDLANRIESVKDRGAAIEMIEGSPKISLAFFVLPECPIMAGFLSEAHLEAIQPMLRRCALVLGYDLT
jgi:hypothetical protein